MVRSSDLGGQTRPTASSVGRITFRCMLSTVTAIIATIARFAAMLASFVRGYRTVGRMGDQNVLMPLRVAKLALAYLYRHPHLNFRRKG